MRECVCARVCGGHEKESQREKQQKGNPADVLYVHGIGPHAPQVDHNPPGQGRPAPQHPDTDQRRPRYEQERHRLHQPPGQRVCPVPVLSRFRKKKEERKKWRGGELTEPRSYRANEHTQGANKKTIMPQDVFAALDDIEFPFLREPLEAEFKSMRRYVPMPIQTPYT